MTGQRLELVWRRVPARRKRAEASRLEGSLGVRAVRGAPLGRRVLNEAGH